MQVKEGQYELTTDFVGSTLFNVELSLLTSPCYIRKWEEFDQSVQYQWMAKDSLIYHSTSIVNYTVT